MTGLEMQIEFERMLQLSNPNLEYSERPDTETIYAYLNKAVLKMLNEIYLPLFQTAKNIEIVANGMQDLGSLIIKDFNVSLTPPNNGLLPSNMFHYIGSSSKINRETVYPMTEQIVDNKLVSVDTFHKYRTNGFNTPIIRKPIVCLKKHPSLNNNISISMFVDRYTQVISFYVTYIKKPNLISFDSDCELSVHLHNRVVELARDLFNSEKYKLSSSNNNKQDKKDE